MDDRNVMTVDVDELLHSLDHARLDHPTTVKAFDVLRSLREWIQKHPAALDRLGAFVTVSAGSVELFVGETCVWSTETNSEDELSFEACRAAYLKELGEAFEPFAVECRCEPEEVVRTRNLVNERHQLLALTETLDEHPEGYDGPCLCYECRSYGD